MGKDRKKIRGTLLLNDDTRSLGKAASILAGGGTVAFPTETVYGLGASAWDAAAVEKIFRAKGRPADNPLIVHISSMEQLGGVVSVLTRKALSLTNRFWPGPLSLVLHKNPRIAGPVSAGLSTVAVRMPDHPVALELIRRANVPVAAPSANRSGRPSPTTYRHVVSDLAGRVDAIIKSGSCRVGMESTVLDVSGPVPVILRPGGVTREELEGYLHEPVAIATGSEKDSLPVSPGMKYRHYAPRAPVFLIAGPVEARRAAAKKLLQAAARCGRRAGHLAARSTGGAKGRSADRYARFFYRALRALDRSGLDLIVAEAVEPAGIGLAVLNRLQKAAVRVIKAG